MADRPFEWVLQINELVDVVMSGTFHLSNLSARFCFHCLHHLHQIVEVTNESRGNTERPHYVHVSMSASFLSDVFFATLRTKRYESQVKSTIDPYVAFKDSLMPFRYSR